MSNNSTLSLNVYTDVNGDGTQESGEGNLAGVTVNLLTGAGVATGQSAVTNSAGQVSFEWLAPGSYELQVVTPAGDVITQCSNVGTPIWLAAGQTVWATEGVYVPASFDTHVYIDANANGTQDGGDSNLAGVTVSLLTGAGVATGQTGTTDSSGNVYFSGLKPGSYEVAVTTPSGDVITQKSNVGTPVTLTSGQTVWATEGVYVPASFDTHVYIDANANGTQDGGDSNLAGVTVSLLTGAGVATGQTGTTDSSGNVYFSGLKPGSYEVAVTTPSGDVITQKSNVGTPVTLTSGQTVWATEGVYVPASFDTHVYIDANANGTQDGGDSNLAGVTVSLLTGAGVATGQTGTTDSSGNVYFSGLKPGSYEVAVTTPSGDVITQKSNVGTPVTLTSGQTVWATEGVYLPASFDTHVYIDANANGTQDGGDSNLAGVTVSLLTGAGVATGQTGTTDSSGNVYFSGLKPGSYEVAVTTPSGDVITQKSNVGTPVTLTSGQTVWATEGVYLPASFDTHVYIDANANGTQDGGDSNLAGVTVSLLTGAGVATGQTGTTDSYGNVYFSGLKPGSYEVAVTTPSGDVVTQKSNVGTPVTLSSGQTVWATEGVYLPATFNTHLYVDSNGDGAQESGEANLPGVEVLLLNGAGVFTGAYAYTDGNGNVSFTGLTPGSYEVVVSAGGTVTQHTNIATPVTLTSGATANAVEGIYVPAAFDVHVYTDANANGTQDGGDSNLAGVTVSLLTGAGVATGQTGTTDSYGNVYFSGLKPGSYEVAVTTPSGDVVTQKSNVGTPVTLSSGQTVWATEGVYLPATFNTHLYVDSNGDGAQESGEANLPGVEVLLLNGAGVFTGEYAYTDGNGNVSFTGLTPGSYEVVVSAGGTVTQHTNIATPVTLTSGATANAVEGIYVPAAFDVHVYTDANANGTQDGGDSNLAGVMVSLLTGAGVATGQTGTTDSYGNVYFSGLKPGSYEVAVTTPSGDVITQKNNVGTPVTLSSGQTVWATEGVYLPATFNTHLYVDSNGDGAQESGEANLPGVEVLLLNGAGVFTGEYAYTDGNGNVSFTGLTPGSYEVVVSAGGTVTQHTNIATPVTLTSGATANAVEGIYVPAAFDVHVYTDANANGTQDGGDSNLAGVMVSLLTGAGVATGQTGTTDSYGNVYFSGLKPGSYEVAVTTPSGDVITQKSNIGTPVTLTSGQTVWATEGVYLPATFNTHLYVDSNGDGAQESGEANLPGVEVLLLNGAGVFTGEYAYTDGNGNVSFTGLTPGSYEVVVSAGGTVTQHTNIATPITLTSGSTVNAVEGIYVPATFNTHIYTDTNGNGAQDGSEPNLAGVDVLLFTGSGTYTGQSAYTNSSGNVSFSGLTPGSYEVGVVTPSGDVVTQNTNVGTPISLSSGQTVQATEGVFAEASFTTHVYCDTNGDGTQDYGEANFAGVTVDLFNGAGVFTGHTATTDSNGNATFSGILPPGSWEVGVVTPSGYNVTQHTNVGTPITVTSGGTISATEGLQPTPCTQYGNAKEIEFKYGQSNTVSGACLSSGLASCQGSSPSSSGFIEITNSANDYQAGCSTYFAGSVSSGQELYASALSVAGGSFASTMYIHVFSSQLSYLLHQNAIQEGSYTCGVYGQNVNMGDQIGALTVSGYVGSYGQHTV